MCVEQTSERIYKLCSKWWRKKLRRHVWFKSIYHINTAQSTHMALTPISGTILRALSLKEKYNSLLHSRIYLLIKQGNQLLLTENLNLNQNHIFISSFHEFISTNRSLGSRKGCMPRPHGDPVCSIQNITPLFLVLPAALSDSALLDLVY